MTISELIKGREEISVRDRSIKEMNMLYIKNQTFYGACFSSSSVNLAYKKITLYYHSQETDFSAVFKNPSL